MDDSGVPVVSYITRSGRWRRVLRPSLATRAPGICPAAGARVAHTANPGGTAEGLGLEPLHWHHPGVVGSDLGRNKRWQIERKGPDGLKQALGGFLLLLGRGADRSIGHVRVVWA